MKRTKKTEMKSFIKKKNFYLYGINDTPYFVKSLNNTNCI